MELPENFFDFLAKPDKKAFLISRKYILDHEDYDPYSDDLEAISALLEDKEFTEVQEYNDINILLSPRAHFMKAYAFESLGLEKEAEYEQYMAEAILQSILLTGDGSRKKPYLVVRVSDEQDLLFYFGEKKVSLSLIKENSHSLDCLKTASGKEYYFDITEGYDMLGEKFSKKGSIKKPKDGSDKKWWEFWK